MDYMRRGVLEFAADAFRVAIEEDPGHQAALYNLAVVLTAMDDWPDAYRVIAKFLERAPEDFLGHLLMGVILREMKRYPKALKSFENAMRLGGAKAIVCTQIGKTYLEQGRLEEARGWFEKALRNKSTSVHARCGLGEVYEREEDYELALRVYKKTIPWSDPLLAMPLFLRLGVLLRKMGRWEEARNVLAQVTMALQKGQLQEPNGNCVQTHQRTAELVEVYYNLGWVLNRLNQHHDAIASYRQGLKLVPNHPQIFFHLGWSLMHTKQPEQAAEAFIKAIRIQPRFIEAHYHLGLCLVEKGDGHGAYSQYKILENLNKELAMRLLEHLDQKS